MECGSRECECGERERIGNGYERWNRYSILYSIGLCGNKGNNSECCANGYRRERERVCGNSNN